MISSCVIKCSVATESSIPFRSWQERSVTNGATPAASREDLIQYLEG